MSDHIQMRLKDSPRLAELAQRDVVRVSVPVDVAYDLDRFQKVQRDILGRLGHAQCYSGWDIRWDIVRNFAVDPKLNVREIPSPQW
jgi:hypothetical protein